MLLDPDNQYIRTINAHAPLAGKLVLEIGCGDGRITRDLANHADQVVATDLSPTILEKARYNVRENNVEFLLIPDGFADLPPQSFDLVIYTLSLHHIPQNKMVDNLNHSGRLLKDRGKIIVIEPGNRGSYLEVKNRFGAGSGDESVVKAAAITAMKSLDNWKLSPTYHFSVGFLFTDPADFYSNKLPEHHKLPAEKRAELQFILQQHTETRGIILYSERHMNLLSR